jgi:hypothetical protein
MPTLTPTEILADVIGSFRKSIPLALNFSTNFQSSGIRLNKTYTAHVATVPVAENVTSTYAVTGNDARNLLTDVPITVTSRVGARLIMKNIDAIADDKAAYDEVIRGAGYAVGKAFIDDLLANATSRNFSNALTYGAADSDVDMLIAATAQLNNQSAARMGRSMVVNSAVANALQADTRLTSRDFAGQMQGEDGYRSWRGTNGFSLIQEYPDMPTGNGTAVTGGAITASTNIYAKTAHGFQTGQRVILNSITNGAGLTALNYYFFHRLGADSGYLCTTVANAIAGTSVDVTTDATNVVLTAAENVSALATDTSGIVFLAGPEDHGAQDAIMQSLGIPSILAFDTVRDPDSGITMSAVKFQDPSTGDLTFMPVLLWGDVAGRQGGTNPVGYATDNGGLLIRTA